MSTNPSMSALLSHRLGVFLRNDTLSSGSATDLWVQRVQTAEPTGTSNSTDYWQLGSVDKAGNTLDPTTFRVVLEENLHDSTLDMTLAGINPSTGSGFWAGNMVSQTNNLYLLSRNDANAVIGEVAIGTLRVSELQYRFVMNGACTLQVTLEGTTGSHYTTSFPHPTWGSFDNLTPGAVHGKDARVCFGSNAAGSKAYRLQSFTIRVQFPVQTVRELGNRQLVGQLVDTPTCTVDFDLNPGDYQPTDVFFPTSSQGYVLSQPQQTTVFVNLYDPAASEGSSVIKSWKLENMRPSTATPLQGRVRNLATARYTMTNVSVSTATSGGVIVSKTEIAA